MSRHRTLAVTCPACDHPQDVTVWDSLNVQLSPEGKEAFFNGEINVLQCAACGHKAALACPFLYHDMALQFCVQFYPPQSIEDEVLLRHHDIDGTMSTSVFGGAASGKMLDKANYMLRPHIVFSMLEALTYVVFRENLAAFHAPDEQTTDETQN